MLKITCLQEVLAHGLGHISSVVSARSTLVESQDVLLQIADGQLKASGTNVEEGLALSIKLSAQVEGEGAIAVPAKTLNELIRILPKGEVVLEAFDEPLSLKVTTASGVTQLLAHSSDNFPPLPTVDQSDFVTLPATQFAGVLSRTLRAVATDNSRPILTGVKFDLEGGNYTLAAADGYRLAVDQGQLERAQKEIIGVVVPRKCLDSLKGLLEGGAKEVQFHITKDKRRALFQLDGVELVTQILEGDFPDYNKLLPTSSSTEVVIPVDKFASAARMAAVIVNETTGTIRCRFTKKEGDGGGNLHLSSEADDIGNSDINIPVELSGEEFNIAFNHRFLNDLIDSVEGDKLKLSASSPSNPGLFTTSSLDNFKHVIMPIFVHW